VNFKSNYTKNSNKIHSTTALYFSSTKNSFVKKVHKYGIHFDRSKQTQKCIFDVQLMNCLKAAEKIGFFELTFNKSFIKPPDLVGILKPPKLPGNIYCQ
jgi:hypothetical protein